MLRPQKKQKPPPRSNDAGNSRHDYSRRRWEDLDADCLTNVFAKVGMESLLLALPSVCKSWYAASLNPICWEILHFPEFEPYPLFSTVDDTNVEPKSFGPFYNKFVEDYIMTKSIGLGFRSPVSAFYGRLGVFQAFADSAGGDRKVEASGHLTLGGNMENIMRQFRVKGGEHSSRDFEEKLLVLLDNVHPIRYRNLHEILVRLVLKISFN
ncbi:hypothetical protein ACLB2K_065168 [Fragaria x ananassa]